MRHVRKLGLCLLAALALAAVGASMAYAHNPGELTGKWKIFKGCPYNNPEILKADKYNEEHNNTTTEGVCVIGKTSGGSTGGFFSLGRVVVPLSKPITLQAAVITYCEEPEGPGEGCGGKAWEENEEDFFITAVHPEAGQAETLIAPELTVPGGIKIISESVQNSAHWPEALKALWKEALKNKEGGLKLKIELAGGNRFYEETNSISGNRLIEAHGTAIELPVKVRLISPALTKLGGGPCMISTDEHPVVQHLSSGKSGNLTGEVGEIRFYEEFGITEVAHDTLVDNTWPVEVPAQGCGGPEYETYVDDAISKVLGIPSPAGAGQTVLTGTLWQGTTKHVRNDAETGKP